MCFTFSLGLFHGYKFLLFVKLRVSCSYIVENVFFTKKSPYFTLERNVNLWINICAYGSKVCICVINQIKHARCLLQIFESLEKFALEEKKLRD